ncbi:MAG: hypothetical protein KDB00_06320, partial [Planctomycetales bacterium]|nr:hypothetical protein [Planctomycetales bacterium]
PFVLDCHTGAYTNRRWRYFQWLQHFLGRQAAANIVTNDHLKELVEENGGTAVIVRDVPVIFEFMSEYPLSDGFNVAAVCSFNYDEPIAAMFEAAAQLSDTNFYFTGNPKHLSPEISELRPGNVQLTGFLSDSDYGSLLNQADVVLTLTTQNHTMLRGAWESIYQCTPVIVSDWDILRTAFDDGAVHVDNTTESIVNAIRFVQANVDELREGASKARRRRIDHWQEVKSLLIEKTR